MTLTIAEMTATTSAAASTITALPSSGKMTPSSSTDSLPPTSSPTPPLTSIGSGSIRHTTSHHDLLSQIKPITAYGIRPSIVTSNGMRFMITECPNDSNLPSYLAHFKKKNVVCVVRACEKTYDTKILVDAGIQCEACEFPDGDAPSDSIISRWLSIVNSVMMRGSVATSKTPTNTTTTQDDDKNGDDDQNSKNNLPTIFVHCVAGLGRAPLLCAIALVNAGMPAFDAVALIRKKRRGAINSKQLLWIEEYHQRQMKRVDACCIIA